MADTDATDVFVYTGIGEGAVVPSDAVRVRIDPTVLGIPDHAFSGRSKMEMIELHDGLSEIGDNAFENCTSLREVELSDGVEVIGSYAFAWCDFTKFRIPPLVTRIPPRHALRLSTNVFLGGVSKYHRSGNQRVH
jgi:hypothetical protein